MESISTLAPAAPVLNLTSEALLNHWQGHRRLTRKVIEAFPEEALFTFSVGGMRTFAVLVQELIDIATPGMRGILTGDWGKLPGDHAVQASKAELLKVWDNLTEQINEGWAQIPSQRLHVNESAFGLYEAPIWSTLFYFIDNEIHHRAQGYVYLRALGVEPPAFWDRE